MGHIDKIRAIETARAQLGVGAFASQNEIRDKWLYKVDILREAQQDAEDRLNKLNAAYELLLPGGPARVPVQQAKGKRRPISRPISKPLEERSHVRPIMISRDVSQDAEANTTLRSREEDAKIAESVRQILSLA